MAGRITVLIAEAMPLTQRGLVASLGEDPEFEIVGLASDKSAAVEMAQRLRPRVVLIGSQAQQADVVLATSAIRSELPDAEILVIGPEDDVSVFSVMEAGAVGYMLQDVSIEDLREAIHSLCNGLTAVHPRIVRKMVDRLMLFSQGGSGDRSAGLTPRDLEVLVSMAAGQTDKEIAHRLSVTVATIKSHIRTVFHKTGTVNRAQAVALAMRIGLIR